MSAPQQPPPTFVLWTTEPSPRRVHVFDALDTNGALITLAADTRPRSVAAEVFTAEPIGDRVASSGGGDGLCTLRPACSTGRRLDVHSAGEYPAHLWERVRGDAHNEKSQFCRIEHVASAASSAVPGATVVRVVYPLLGDACLAWRESEGDVATAPFRDDAVAAASDPQLFIMVPASVPALHKPLLKRLWGSIIPGAGGGSSDGAEQQPAADLEPATSPPAQLATHRHTWFALVPFTRPRDVVTIERAADDADNGVGFVAASPRPDGGHAFLLHSFAIDDPAMASDGDGNYTSSSSSSSSCCCCWALEPAMAEGKRMDYDHGRGVVHTWTRHAPGAPACAYQRFVLSWFRSNAAAAGGGGGELVVAVRSLEHRNRVLTVAPDGTVKAVDVPHQAAEAGSYAAPLPSQLFRLVDVSAMTAPRSQLPAFPGFEQPAYQAIRRLGEGGWSVCYLAAPVWRATAEADGDTGHSSRDVVAVKVGKSRAGDGDRREVAVLSKLPPHPNIVRYIASNFAASDARMQLVTEYCNGREWREAIGFGFHLPVVAKADVCRQLFSAVAHLHANQLLHRDIHGGNVLLTVHARPDSSDTFDDSGTARHATCKVIDLGSTVAISEAGKSRNRNLWIRPYHSDERLRSGGTSAQADDVFAAATLMVELCFGLSITQLAQQLTGDVKACERPACGKDGSPHRGDLQHVLHTIVVSSGTTTTGGSSIDVAANEPAGSFLADEAVSLAAYAVSLLRDPAKYTAEDVAASLVKATDAAAAVS